ncbi:hypothetical protein O5O45_00675 [Hahella aquimaris]|uniref:hypothetical protein n=1 Tax=Hahella sp. HNIBRBA332 TaxID=3015983 RepID=UPI00273B8EEE|nr:hypothetical protein [Hahella sp. HNIBRBA332]WLQ14449.1 hypothetical protein O5O45_00675 [Hahella sp. HNIBRBA332]
MQDEGFDLCHWEAGGLIGDLRQPFPHSEAWNLPPSFWEGEPNPEEEDTEEMEDELWEAWDQKLEEQYWAEAIVNGAIPICHEGCAIRFWMIITGELKGTIWEDLRCDNQGIRPLKDDEGNFVTFTDWYLGWLEQSLAEC